MTTASGTRQPLFPASYARLAPARVPGRRLSAMQRLEGVVHQERRPHERLGHANGAFAWALRLLPVPHQRTDQPETVGTGVAGAGLGDRGRGRAGESVVDGVADPGLRERSASLCVLPSATFLL